MHNGAIMPTELRHLFDRGQPYPVVRLVGVLDSGTAPQARSALLDGLAEQPAALLVDVADAAVGDLDAVQVLGDVVRETADWPAAPLAIYAPDNVDAWRSSGLPVWPSRAAAFTAFGPPEPSRQVTLSLDPIVGAARRARELVTEACTRWHLMELAGPASIVVSEMANNVVAHARTMMTVRLAVRGRGMTVSVQDHNPKVPRFTGPVAPTSYGGRGLLLIDSVAHRWGNLRLDDGKVVWAILHPEDEPVNCTP